MALLLQIPASSTRATVSTLLSSLSSSSSPSLTFALTSFPLSRLCNNPLAAYPKPYVACSIQPPFLQKERRAPLAKASAEGANSDGPELPSESEEEDVPIQNLPLESKLQLKLEQKMRMKLAKKIRLRRKKLVRKRRLRKKGRWPPSKLKKNKNV
ncbi:unnamed protein product [Coffea canephora]|uniref:50S ribosomal protein 5, chloroplastic n=2 Tax=Coffea TaxID=13442 RepID=A0A068V101_COFCA|nr:50S ribosomal protein 5 alpha, chloroplastic-like [Coffea arabica]XP_027071039.1 50S ribosomal protein 5 alpha, chloroplastic-like [Coffea arabica]XP_027071040.1 50S ribosomal protein 5 alpha, chloroplastic-like [Coffea arabica]XP_027071042.1 50S ribosomal protein 5 alpha, chloroplastic-like [Coffea arabica]CDP14336.1 unnamed protein product [Coffea canephora]